MDSIVKLGLDVYHGNVQTEYTNGKDAEEQLRAALIKANGGKETIDVKTLRDNKQIFTIIEEILEIAVEEGMKGDEFFMKWVDYRNLAEGDRNEFVIEADSEFIVADMSKGIATPRRQRIGEETTLSIPTKTSGIRVYEELSRVLAGRVKWATFIEKAVQAITKDRYDKIFTAFMGITKDTRGLSETYIKAGTYDEEALLEMVEHLEAATGAKAEIIGVKQALRKIKTAEVSDEARSSYYNVGHYGKVAGVNMTAINQIHKAGTETFMLPTDTVWVVASNDPFIKFVTEGEGYISDRPADNNADFTQEYLYIERTGCSVVMKSKIGRYTFA